MDARHVLGLMVLATIVVNVASRCNYVDYGKCVEMLPMRYPQTDEAKEELCSDKPELLPCLQGLDKSCPSVKEFLNDLEGPCTKRK